MQFLATCVALGLSVSSAYADEAHHPDDGQAAATTAMATAPTGNDGASDTPPAMPAGQGVMPMMGMGHMPGNQGGMPMMGRMMGMSGMPAGQQGGMPMMNRMMGKGMMGKAMHGGHGMMAMHNQVLSRLDLMEARLAKMEVLLERMTQR
jgi:hypothetical protein